jgi:hypothetical protein
MTILHFLATGALLAIGRFLFLLCAKATRQCRWCKPESRWCLRCRCTREHFRLGARTAHRVRLAALEAYREATVKRALAKLEDRR